MNKFLFKSTDADFQKLIFNKLEMLLAEQRNQRHDLRILQQTVNKLVTDENLQKQVDNFFEKDPFGSHFRTANKIAEDDDCQL